jgi:hypothetical protein
MKRLTLVAKKAPAAPIIKEPKQLVAIQKLVAVSIPGVR